MTIILGVDPGSRRTGYGVIRQEGNSHQYLTSGFIDLTKYKTIAERLRHIYLGLSTVITNYHPDEAAIEEVFMHENPNSAIKLGQARGAAIVALNMPVSEYAAREIKKSVVGTGAAKKDQVQFMVKRLLNISGDVQADAADALAVALCHAQSRVVARWKELTT